MENQSSCCSLSYILDHFHGVQHHLLLVRSPNHLKEAPTLSAKKFTDSSCFLFHLHPDGQPLRPAGRPLDDLVHEVEPLHPGRVLGEGLLVLFLGVPEGDDAGGEVQHVVGAGDDYGREGTRRVGQERGGECESFLKSYFWTKKRFFLKKFVGTWCDHHVQLQSVPLL